MAPVILIALLVLLSNNPPSSALTSFCPLSGTYRNISFVRFVPTTLQQLHVLQNLATYPCNFHLITPAKPTLFKRHAFILTASVLQLLRQVSPATVFETRSPDLSAEYANLPHQRNDSKSTDEIRPDLQYYTLPLLYASWEQLADRHHPHVSLIHYGTSWNGNPLVALYVSPESACLNCKPSRPVLLLTALIHAREWATVLAADRVLRELLTPSGLHMLARQGIDAVIVPMANPDGYAYSREGDRLWRRNRPPLAAFKCGPVDLLLNFPPVTPFIPTVDQQGHDPDPCSDEYEGPFPLSEPESQNMVHLVTNLIGIQNIRAHLDVHSYGCFVRGPWHIGETVASDHLRRLDGIGQVLAHAMSTVHGLTYSYRRHSSSYEGYFGDWLFSQNVLSYTISIRPIRDTDFERAFALPLDEARKAADEVVAVVFAIATLVNGTDVL